MGNFGALALSLGLIGWAAAMRAVAGTWLQPSALFALWWCFAGIGPLLLVPNEPVAENAVVWLLAASMAVSAGAAIGNRGFKTRLIAAPPPPTDRELGTFSVVLAVSIVLGLTSNVVFVQSFGISLAEVMAIERLVVVSNQLYVWRYAEIGPSRPPMLSQAFLPFVYLAPAVGGVLFVLRREVKWKVVSLASFLPATAVTVLQTTKAAMLFAMLLWLSSYFATRLRAGKLRVFTRGHLLASSVLAAVVIALFLAVGLARLSSTDVGLAGVVMLKLVTAAFGHMTVFSRWLAEFSRNPFEPTLGAVTFSGPLEMFGFGRRMPGLFESVVDLVAGDTSNIYTGFRPLIQDFGIAGALMVLGVLGFAGGVAFRLVAIGKWSAFPLLLAVYMTILWTPVTWFWVYNSLTASVVAVGLMVFFIRLWRGTSAAAPVTRERFVSTT